MEILREYQADIMLVLSGICGIMALFVYMTNAISAKRKVALMLLEISAMLLLISDRRAYIFRGDPSSLGWVMVRLSNFLVFFLTLVIIYAFNMYLIDLFTSDAKLEKTPRRLEFVRILLLVGMGLVVLSQFTGFYYTFDEMNRYQRAPGFILCYAIPLAVILIQLSVILQHFRRLSRSIALSLILFTAVSIIASIFQVFLYGISLNNIAIVLMAALLYVFALKDMNREVEHARRMEIEYYRQEQQKEHALFEQTAQALASAIDAKDRYTHGHSTRVAMYSTQLAREAGKSEEECEEVYFAALLHDVGKIGIPDAIINKDGKLTDGEFDQIKLHPVYGNQILSSIRQSPYLSIGAHYHHERYDGRGYPDGLAGEDIPELARIIAVADSYDAMTSKRSYRDPIPQQKVREELVEGMGTQFDPTYAKIMLHLIDKDVDYAMREQDTAGPDAAAPGAQREGLAGILLTDKPARICLRALPAPDASGPEGLPALLLFDALDARVHVDEKKQQDLVYLEYGQIRFDGQTKCTGARKMETTVLPGSDAAAGDGSYVVEGVRVKDHARIRISDGTQTLQTVVALPYSSRYAYVALTGEHCTIRDVRVEREETPVAAEDIPRIAEEISYINDCPQGDVPNVQIDSRRSDATEGIPVTDGLRISFHSQSLPTARLIWHCPYVCVYTASDGRVGGADYRELLLLRLDGESEEPDGAEADVQVTHGADFPGWSAWKEHNRRGMDCTLTLHRAGADVDIATENLGIAIAGHLTLNIADAPVYVSLTGDQCALTNIRCSTAKK